MSIIAVTILIASVGAVLEISEQIELQKRADQQHLIDTGQQLISITEHFFNHHEDVVRTLAETDCVKNWEQLSCSKLLSRLNQTFPHVTNFAVIDKDGRFFASGKPFNTDHPPSVSDKPFFKALSEGRPRYAMSPHISPISKKLVTGLVTPLQTTDGEFNGLIGAGISFSQLKQQWRQVYAAHRIEAVILDQDLKAISASSGLGSKYDKNLLATRLQNAMQHKGVESSVQLGEQTFNYRAFVSDEIGWSAVALQPSTPPLITLMTQHPGATAMLLGFLVLASIALLKIRGERRLIQTLVISDHQLRNQKDDLEALVDARTSDLTAHEKGFRQLFENSVVSIWNEDLSEVYSELGKLRESGVTDLKVHFQQHPDLPYELLSKIVVLDVNQATLKMFCAPSKEHLFRNIHLTFTKNSSGVFIEELCAIWDQQPSFRSETEFQTLDGEVITAIISFSIPTTLDGFNSIPVSILDISDRKQSEEDLKLFRDLLDESNDSIVISSPEDGQVVDCNLRIGKALGYSREEMLALKVRDIQTLLPDQAAWDKHVADLREGGSKVVIGGHRRKDGSHMPVEVFVKYIELPKNDYILAVARDISQRIKAEESLIQTEERLNEAQRIAHIGSFEGYLDGPEIWWSDELYRLFGLTRETFVPTKKSFFSLLHRNDYERYNNAIKYTLETGEDFRQEYQAKHSNGEWRHFETIASAVTDQQGQVIGLRGTVQDITSRKMADHALQQSEQRFRNIFEQAAVGVALIDSNSGEFLRINKRYCDMLGYTKDEMTKSQSLQQLSHPDDLDDYLNNMQRLLAGDNTQFAMEKRYYHKDGSIIWVNLSVTPAWLPGEEPTQHIAVVEDITSRKQSEQALRRTQKMEAIGQLTGGIAHDFNNILGIILGNANLLQRQVLTDPKLLKRVETIQKSAQRAADLTKQLLGFSRQKVEQASITNLNSVVKGMEALIDRSATPQIEVIKDFDPLLWSTRIDASDFEDALLNLILNARDAMPDGGILTITTRNQHLTPIDCATIPNAEPGNYVSLTVKDTGEGIPARLQERIFEPFFTTKPPGKGTGLGLAMVFGFVDRSNGCIQVDSIEGKSTAFTIYLHKCNAIGEIEEKTPEQNLLSLPGTESILVVDDEPGLLELAEEILKPLGYKVRTAKDARSALIILNNDPEISLLFSDVVMPGGISGFELADQATKAHPHLKVLLTSGYSEKMATNTWDSPFKERLLAKPYSSEELAQRIRETLDEEKSNTPSRPPVKTQDGKDQVLKIPEVLGEDKKVGIEKIDAEHQELLDLLNLGSQAIQESSESKCAGILDQLLEFTRHHFPLEEAVMKACEYPGYRSHQQVHQLLISQLDKMSQRMHKNELSAQALLQFLMEWWIDHTHRMDQSYKPYTQGKDQLIQATMKEFKIGKDTGEVS